MKQCESCEHPVNRPESPRARFCFDCLEARQRTYQNEYRRLERAAKPYPRKHPHCADCGADITNMHQRARRCKSCARKRRAEYIRDYHTK